MIQGTREVGHGDIKLLQKLSESKNSVVFKVDAHGTICVMKVVSTTQVGPASFLNPSVP